MEFRRVEIKRSVRHVERIVDAAEMKAVFESIMRNCLAFSATVPKVGILRNCRVGQVGDSEVMLVSRAPHKLVVEAKFSDIESIEVESNCDFILEERDDGGRWARLIS